MAPVLSRCRGSRAGGLARGAGHLHPLAGEAGEAIWAGGGLGRGGSLGRGLASPAGEDAGPGVLRVFAVTDLARL